MRLAGTLKNGIKFEVPDKSEVHNDVPTQVIFEYGTSRVTFEYRDSLDPALARMNIQEALKETATVGFLQALGLAEVSE